MVDVIRVSRDENPISEVRREWLVTNGLGGFASATISGEITRRYHGFLIAALPAPIGRMVMLNDLEIAIERPDGSTALLRESGHFLGFTLSMVPPSPLMAVPAGSVSSRPKRSAVTMHAAGCGARVISPPS